MILARRQAAPLRFLIGVTIAWVAGRGAMVAGWRPAAAIAHAGPAPGLLLALMPVLRPGWQPGAHADLPAGRGRVGRPAGRAPIGGGVRAGPSRPRETMRLMAASARPAPEAGETPAPAPAPSLARPPAPAAPSAATATLATPPAPAHSGMLPRLSGSAWMFVRDGSGGGALAPDGQLGGSQAGVRLLYRLEHGLSVAARISRALAGPAQGEAAIGIDWQLPRGLPVHLMLDRRIALGSGGRHAWAAGVAGGAYAVRLAEHVRLDGYGQAGIVGAHRRDLYADGAVRIGRTVDLAPDRGLSLTLGGGAWGAAQPGVARLDLGPSAVLRLPLGTVTLAAALDWRGRVAGDARPGSGTALTIGVDF